MEYGGLFVMMTSQFLQLQSSVIHWDFVVQHRPRRMVFLALEKVRSGWTSYIAQATRQE
jgi:hypothetical protein